MDTQPSLAQVFQLGKGLVLDSLIHGCMEHLIQQPWTHETIQLMLPPLAQLPIDLMDHFLHHPKRSAISEL